MTETTIMTESQLLERLPICRRTLYQWRKDGRIPWIPHGRSVLYHWPSVESALVQNQNGVRKETST